MNSNTIIEVLNCLIGSTEPYGSSHIDEQREENLKTLIDITNWCLDGIAYASEYKNRQEYSMRQIGQRAFACLDDYKTWIEKRINE